MKTRQHIYLSPPHQSGRERQLLLDALTSNWLAPVGPHVDAFERELASTLDVPAAAAVSSGTAAIHLALRVAGVGPGDEVLVSTLTFIASAAPIVYLGATPVFIDSEPRSWNIDPDLLTQTIERRVRRGRRPKAVVVVHLFGQSAELQPILEICRRYDIPVIEDAAEGLGAFYEGRPTGTLGLLGTFSFNGNKVITTAGGGALVSSDPALLEHARFLAAQARDDAPHYEHSEIGYNYRMSNLLAALGRAQLQVLAERVNARRRNARIYQQQLGDLPGLHFQREASWGKHARWLTCATIDPHYAGIDRVELQNTLAAADIETRPVFKPLHLQPVFAGCEAVGGEVAQTLFETGICLPSGSNLTDAERAFVIETIRAAFERADPWQAFAGWRQEAESASVATL